MHDVLGLKGSSHQLRHPSQQQQQQLSNLIGPELEPLRSHAGQQHNSTSTDGHMATIKQEMGMATLSGGNSDLMVPGQTQIGSPDAISPYVDSTTYPSRLTPPGSNADFFSLQEELINGILYTI